MRESCCGNHTEWYGEFSLLISIDVYLEDFSGEGEVGCDRFKTKGVDFDYWSRVGGPAYRFNEVVLDETLKQSIAEYSTSWAMQSLPMEHGGWRISSCRTAPLLMPQHSWVTVWGKGPGGQSGAHRVTGPLATPPKRYLWLSAESGPTVFVGDEVDIQGLGGVRMDDSSAAFALGVWVRSKNVELLPEVARRYLDRPELMLKEDPPTEPFTPYWDPCLLHSKPAYVAFIRKLLSIDFLLFTTQPKEHIGVFFVHKSDA